MNIQEIDGSVGGTGQDSAVPEIPRQGDGNAKRSIPKIEELFKRNLTAWPLALLHGWWLIVLCAIVLGFSFFLFRYLTAPKLYETTCTLVRQELVDVRNSGLPPGLTKVQTNTILNMIRSRGTLMTAARRLELDIPYESMFGMVSIKQAAKNSDYFYIMATTGDPKMSVRVANMIAQVFLDEYKKMLDRTI